MMAGRLLLLRLWVIALLAVIDGIQIDFGSINIDQLQKMMLSGVKCRDILDSFLERIQTYENGPQKLNVIISLNNKASDEADYLDQFLRERRNFYGRLHCVPMVVSDNIDVVGMNTTAGLSALYGSVATTDAGVVSQLKSQGAVVLAKTNVAPLGWERLFTLSETGGDVKNGYGRLFTPYGANGGTAQAVASGYALIGVGVDGGGSVGFPADAASVLGLRPSYNTGSDRGVVPADQLKEVVGLFVKRAVDLAKVMDVIDTSKSPSDIYNKMVDSTQSTLNRFRIGVMWEAFYSNVTFPPLLPHDVTHRTFQISRETRPLLHRALSDLKLAGAELVNITLDIKRAYQFITQFNAYDASLCVGKWMDEYLKYVKPSLSLRDLLRGGKLAQRYQQYLNTADQKSRLYKCDEMRTQFENARKMLQTNVVDGWFGDNLDVLAFPTSSGLPPRRVSVDFEPVLGQNLAALAGHPYLTLPVGFSPTPNDHATGDEAPVGLPTSIVLLGRTDRIASLINIAHVYQKRYGVFVMPPLVGSSSSNVGAAATFVISISTFFVIVAQHLGGYSR